MDKNARMRQHAGVFSVDFSRIDTGKTVCFLVSGGFTSLFAYQKRAAQSSTGSTSREQ